MICSFIERARKERFKRKFFKGYLRFLEVNWALRSKLKSEICSPLKLGKVKGVSNTLKRP
ncbi:hypothetical protein HpKG121_27240 [Helicobacter pylori]